ncbi:methyltransferase domain-containing protein [Rhizorhabdus sp.]|uniref:class I SAM-dependent methyltransferase n=1 Tax=Rhizorhabdus sp. TaxID=1968843 RepID=UPI0019B343F8|nr:methyltransferase domain-containing protein [Rhizorhabdus sp.]MBD3760740.1 methyltransferase domain-containing protein [Rhizorhabdus sp.]
MSPGKTKENQNYLYVGYEHWKGWSSYFDFNAEDNEYFSGEMRNIPILGKRLLEIGFGRGEFLAWAKTQGALVAGVEINNRSVEEAHRANIEILDLDIETLAADHAEQFDVIAAFDVLEHLEIDEITQYMRAMEKMLRHGGILILRFPNGQSPFGLAPQHGDVTHKTALSKSRIEQICQGSMFASVRYEGSYRVRGPWGLKRLARAARSLAQNMIGATLNLVYACDIPWDSVVVMVMRKEHAASGGPADTMVPRC